MENIQIRTKVNGRTRGRSLSADTLLLFYHKILKTDETADEARPWTLGLKKEIEIIMQKILF